jgi:hypothetical protein
MLSTEDIELETNHERLSLLVNYPGRDISGICYIDLSVYNTKANIISLFKDLGLVKSFNTTQDNLPWFKIISANTLRIKLEHNFYVDGVDIMPFSSYLTIGNILQKHFGHSVTIKAKGGLCETK